MPRSESRPRARGPNAKADVLRALSFEERQAYAEFCDDYVAGYETKTEEERELAEQMARLKWEINRCHALEARLFRRYADQNGTHPISDDPDVDRAMQEASAYLANSKELNKISIVEYRLQGRWLRVIKQFSEVQAQREAEERQKRMQKRPWVH